MTNQANRYGALGLAIIGIGLTGSTLGSLSNLSSKSTFDINKVIKSGTFGIDYSSISLIANRSGAISIEYSSPSDGLPNHLENIKKTFSLTNDELAKVIGVTRKTLHNWKTGVTSRAENRQRIFNLFMLAQNWNKAAFSQNKHELNQPIINGKSVIDLLSEEYLDSEQILFAGSRINLLNASIKEGLF
ncbi:MAG: hypothetical protein Q4C98_11510 [Capnocytophaga sp.]|nr:hypothetical protein [Capnocytophaga sp.]